MEAHEEFETEHGDRFDTDGGHDRAARRRELKRTWKRCAARYCREMVATGGNLGQTARAHRAMVDAYEAWKACH